MRRSRAFLAAATLAIIAPGSLFAQISTNPAIAKLEEIVAGKPVEATGNGALAYRVNGREGQRITIDLSATPNRAIRIIVADRSSQKTVHSSTARGQTETITLPADSFYIVQLQDTSFLPGSFLHRVSLDGGSPPTALAKLASAGLSSSSNSIWGPMLALGGREWAAGIAKVRFNWIDPGRVLAWQLKPVIGDWYDIVVLKAEANGIQASVPWRNATGAFTIGPSGEAIINFDDGAMRSVVQEGETFRVSARGGGRIAEEYVMKPLESKWTQTAAIAAAQSRFSEQSSSAVPRSGPIVLGSVGTDRSAKTPASAPLPSGPSRSGSGGPIVLAASPPPPAAIRQAPSPAAGEPATPTAAPNSREALMEAQVAARRQQVAREAEAARAEAAANAASQSEGLGFLGALVGGIALGMQTGGDMGGITTGMALGSSIAAPQSEIATASNSVMQDEMQRLQEQRAHEAAVIAALNDPNNPLTQESRRRDEARTASYAAEQERIDTEFRQRSEEADRDALMQQRMKGAEQDRTLQAEQQEQRAARETAVQEQQRRTELQREREAQQARDEQKRREEEARVRREQVEREAEARRQSQERQRAAAEAERTRVIEFKEAVVLCSLTGPQAQFNNWRCEGPLQMTYINFEQPNVDGHFYQMDCSDYRELPRAGPYRAFGCGYGIHPTNPGAARNVPEMLGVFVNGRMSFRCPRNISGVCKDR